MIYVTSETPRRRFFSVAGGSFFVTRHGHNPMSLQNVCKVPNVTTMDYSQGGTRYS